MGIMRFTSGFCGAPSTLNMALKISFTMTGYSPNMRSQPSMTWGHLRKVSRSLMTNESSMACLYDARPAALVSPASSALTAACPAIWPDATAKSMPRTW